MSTSKGNDRPLLPSILDRLTGKVESASSGQPNQRMSQLKMSVRQDLENLLNTRWRCTSWPEAMKELEESLVNYGIPDFSGLQMSSRDDQESFRKIVEKAIRIFEPRFVSVNVKILEQSEEDRTLKFRIEAELHAHPSPEPVVFDSAIDPASSRIQIGNVNK